MLYSHHLSRFFLDMHFDILTLFPTMFAGPFEESILKRAQEHGCLSITLHNIRDYATDKHHVTDDTPYGGGGGMVMKAEPIFSAVQAILPTLDLPENQHAETRDSGIPVILLSPQGRLFTQAVAWELSRYERLLLICGRYEGVDERVRQHLVTDELSTGDYVLTGGELAAMIVIDAVTRLIPGVLGGEQAAENDSFADGLLEHAHYTRPRIFEGNEVPEVLLSGHHREIDQWRLESSLMRTLLKRSDLLQKKDLNKQEIEILKKWHHEIESILDINNKRHKG